MFSFVLTKVRNTEEYFSTFPHIFLSQVCPRSGDLSPGNPKSLTIFGRTFCRGGAVLTRLVCYIDYIRIPVCSLGGIEPRLPVVLAGGNIVHILSVNYFCWYKGKHLFYYRDIIIDVLIFISTPIASPFLLNNYWYIPGKPKGSWLTWILIPLRHTPPGSVRALNFFRQLNCLRRSPEQNSILK